MLEGLKVVELATFIAGPAAAGMMADWGATVIKVEAPGGDSIRWNRPPAREGGSSPIFEMDNRGKRSIVADFRTPEGCDVIRRLATWADVFITNLRPARAGKSRIDYDSLAALNPRLIYASITGYGLQSPLANASAFDITAFWSSTGLLGQIMPPGGPPTYPPTGMGDHMVGITSALGVMAALWARERTGRGQLVDCSLLRAGSYAAGYDLSEQFRFGKTLPPRKRGMFSAPASPLGWGSPFAAKGDEWFHMYLFQEDEEWPRVLRLFGRPDLAEDPRLATADGRVTHASEIMAAMDQAFAGLTRDEIGAALDAEGIMWSPLHRADTAVRDPANIAAGCFVDVDDGQGGTFRNPAPPLSFPGAESDLKGPVPAPGAHTDEILLQMGYGPDEVAALRRAKAVG